MQWAQQLYMPVLSGLDILFFVLAYMAWRYLTGLGRARKALDVPLPRTTPARRSRGLRQQPIGRWAARSAALRRLQAGTPRRVEVCRQLRRAA